MKTNSRTVTVGDQAFVYWHTSGARFTLYLSPKEQKNTKLVLLFPAFPPDEDPHTSWTFYEILAQKGGEEVPVHLGRPRSIAEIISHLRQRRPGLWQIGRITLIENAWELLGEMGYSGCKPVWKGEF
ncbi:hypothetical protein [Saccharibacillus sacchari]|uniref:Uncharacterized protein n=1 Tax=Saccharibacillus sacchari TaxID=456493 RepID=A0ACC6P9S5_9BACL